MPCILAVSSTRAEEANPTPRAALRPGADQRLEPAPAYVRPGHLVVCWSYHKAELLLELRRAEYWRYIPVLDQKGQRRFADKGGMLAREAFHDDRKCVGRKKGKKLTRLRGERVERTFALACETGGHRRLRLRGRDNARKRYLAHVAALDFGRVMRTLLGRGTPREMAAAIAAAWIELAHLALAAIVRFFGDPIGMLLPRSADNPIEADRPLSAL